MDGRYTQTGDSWLYIYICVCNIYIYNYIYPILSPCISHQIPMSVSISIARGVWFTRAGPLSPPFPPPWRKNVAAQRQSWGSSLDLKPFVCWPYKVWHLRGWPLDWDEDLNQFGTFLEMSACCFRINMNHLPKKSLAYGMRYTWLLSITDDTSWKYIMETPHFGSLFVPMFPVPNSSGAWFHSTSEGNSVACFSERWPPHPPSVLRPNPPKFFAPDLSWRPLMLCIIVFV